MDPFKERPVAMEQNLFNWSQLYYPQGKNKKDIEPYTKLRIILMNGSEYESNWFSHQFSRHCNNNDLRRELALARYIEKQQQFKLACLKPVDESILEQTIGYEQLAVDLTAALAQNEPNLNVLASLNFALLEDFDHLYRYADLLEAEHGVYAEELVGKYTEIMPARPTIAHHRHPFDNIKNPIDKTVDTITKLNTAIIVAAEQQTMNYYMNIAAFYSSDIGRRLYQEIGLVEEEHVTHYGSLLDPNMTWLENLLCHEYTECYLYYSCFTYETDLDVKKIWEQCFVHEITHLHKAVELLKTYEHKDWQEVIPVGEFPELLNLKSNINYVREVIAKTVNITSNREDYVDTTSLDSNSDFVRFQKIVNHDERDAPSHIVIQNYVDQNGSDYRYESDIHPVKELQDRTRDNVRVGRVVKT